MTDMTERVDARTGRSLPPGADRITRALDLCVDMNEPELLMDELFKVAHALSSQNHPQANRHESWTIVANYAKLASDELKAANEPPPKAA